MDSPPALAPSIHLAPDGHAFTTSADVAAVFGKRHGDVIRAIRQLEGEALEDEGLAAFNRRNFASVEYRDGKGEARPLYQLTRDGFALLAMSFTGRDANRWKVAYIAAFNAMEARLSALYVAPLPSDREFTRGIRLKDKLALHEQGKKAARALDEAKGDNERRQAYWKLYQINEALGLPLPTMQALGVTPPGLQADEHERAAL